MDDELIKEFNISFDKMRRFFHSGDFLEEWKKFVPEGFEPSLEMVESLEESDEKFVALTKTGGESYIIITGEKSKDGTIMTFVYARRERLLNVSMWLMALGILTLGLLLIPGIILSKKTKKKSLNMVKYSENNFIPIVEILKEK
jgi:hypothetical protein